jgi:hypothetical protein
MGTQSQSGSNRILHRILNAYRYGGADAVRSFLQRNKIPDAKIEQILAQLQQNFPRLTRKKTMAQHSLLDTPYMIRSRTFIQMDT